MNEDAQRPLWYRIEEEILALGAPELEAGRREQTVSKIASALAGQGIDVSRAGDELLAVRWALDARVDNGRPLLGDLNEAIGAFALEDVAVPSAATFELVRKLGGDWPVLRAKGGIGDVRVLIDRARLDLMIDEARSLEGDKGIRYLRAEAIPGETILDRMGIERAALDAVDAAIAAEKAERGRVRGLLEAVSEQSEREQIRHLVNSGVSDASIIEIAGFEQSAIDTVKVSMEEEIAEQQRKAEEEVARKKAEAEGPALDAIPPDEMLEYIESIREILEIAELEKEIRVMCEQSEIPKSLVDVAVSDPDKLDELEEQAEAAS